MRFLTPNLYQTQKSKTMAKAEISQCDRFKALARELGCDEDEATFKAKLARIARQKPKDESNPKNDAKP